MKRSTVLWALVVLNAALLVGLMWRLSGENAAHAQPGMRSDFVMVPLRIANSPNGAVFIVDTRNGVIGGFAFDSQRGALVPVTPIPLGRVFAAGMRNRP